MEIDGIYSRLFGWSPTQSADKLVLHSCLFEARGDERLKGRCVYVVWTWFFSLSPEYPSVAEYSLEYSGSHTHFTRIMGSFHGHQLALGIKAAQPFSKSKWGTDPLLQCFAWGMFLYVVWRMIFYYRTWGKY